MKNHLLEMKNIFNRCTPKSLILGDEISQGTETLSALAIVSATIKRLSLANSIFVFTTHLHQLHNTRLIPKGITQRGNNIVMSFEVGNMNLSLIMHQVNPRQWKIINVIVNDYGLISYFLQKYKYNL